MNYPRFCFIIILFFILPSLAWADSSFAIPDTDKSMEYLGSVFGRMGPLPGASGNILFGQIMKLFNQIVLALATLIVVYTVVVSTIHTAHEGEVMGKKWSSIFIPARIGAGLWLLVPSASGYSFIQIAIMWLIMQGIGVANGLWEQVLTAYDRGEGIYSTVDVSDLTSTSDLVSPQGDENTLRGVLKSEICLHVVNDNPTNLEAINQGVPLTAFKSLDGTRIIWGIESTEQAVCGSATLPEKTTVDKAYSTITGSTSDAQFEAFRAQVGDAILNGLNQDLSGPAQEAANVDSTNWTDFSSLITAQSNFKKAKQDILAKAANANSQLQTTLAQNALEDGWIHAGSYYSKLIAGNPSETASNINIMVVEPNFNLIGGGDFGDDLSKRINALTTEYLNKANKDRSASDSASTQEREAVATSSLPSPLNEIAYAISYPTWEIAKLVMKNMSSSTQDPMLSIAKMGGLIVGVTEAIFFIFLILVAAAMGIGAIGWGCQAMGHVLSMFFSIALPVFMLFLAFFYIAGLTLALYIPLIPFLVFTFAAITWMILVIEAVVAAPLVALILVVPSEDELGKAGHSIVILLGLILRPALMVLGFILAIKILLITVKMLNFGFYSVVFEHRPALSIFYPIAVVVLYTGILTYMVHEAFSLIYVIPDKVLRWMGGSPEGEDIMGKVKKSESDVEKGASTGKAGMGTVMGSAQSGAATAAKMKK